MLVDGYDFAAAELAAMRAGWDAVAKDWGLSWRERRMLFPAGSEDAPSPPADTETRMRIMIEIGHRLRLEADDDLQDWLREPSELLAWHTPLEAMSSSLADLRRFRRFVEQGFGS